MMSFEIMIEKSIDEINPLSFSSKILRYFIEKNITNLINLVSKEKEYSLKRKFILLLVGCLLEETSLVNLLFNTFSKEYEKELKCKKSSIFNLFYSKDNYKIFQIAFCECMQNNEFEIIKHIFNPYNNLFVLKEEFLIKYFKNANINILTEIANMNLKYIRGLSKVFKSNLRPVELNKNELLKLMCRAKFSNNFIYLFILKSFRNVNEAICILIKENSNRVCQVILNSNNYKSLTIEKFFKIAAKYQNYKFIFNNYTKINSSNLFNPDISLMFSYLVSKFLDSMIYFEFKIYLLTIHFKLVDFNLCKELLLKISQNIQSNSQETNILFFTANPLKTLLMIYELNHEIKNKYQSLSGMCTEIQSFINNSCAKILNSIQHYSEIVIILEDKLFNAEKTIDLITKFNLIELMKTPMLHLYVEQQWRISDQPIDSIFDISTAMKVFSEKYTQIPFEEMNLYLKLPNNYIKGSFVDYIRNPHTKYCYQLFIDFIILIILFIFLLMWSTIINNIAFQIIIFADQNLFNAMKKTMNLLFPAFDLLNKMAFLIVIFIGKIIAILLGTTFIIIKKFTYPIFSFRIVLETFIFIFSIFYFNEIRNKIQEYKEVDQNSDNPINLKKFLNYLETINNYKLLIYGGITCGLAFFKFIFDLKFIRMFGPLISTIEKIFKQLSKFFAIYFLILLTFIAIGTIFFSGEDINDFNGFGNSVITLIGYSYGGFSVSNYENFQNKPNNIYITVIVFCFVFSFMINILFLNLLIGMIGSIYTSTIEIAKELFLIEIYQESKLLSYCSKYSSLNTSNYSLLELTCPFYIGYLFFSKEKINNFILIAQYSFILFINFIIVLAYNIILAPIAYIYGIGKYFNLIVQNHNFNKSTIFLYVLYIMFGLFFFIVTAFINSFHSIYLLVTSSLPANNIDHEIMIPSKLSFKAFLNEIKSMIQTFKQEKELFNPFTEIKLTNLLEANNQNLLKSENKYSHIDLICWFTIFETASSKENHIIPIHILSMIKSQQKYFKLSSCYSVNLFQNRMEKWKRYYLFVVPKLRNKNVVNIFNLL